jgi:AcrR family transcriptional regulator
MHVLDAPEYRGLRYRPTGRFLFEARLQGSARVTNQERSGETRSRILQAALSRFTQRGYDATSVADICATAEVSKGAFYHHFPSKQAVFVALLARWLADLDATVQAPGMPGETAPDRLRRLAALIDEVSELGTGRIPMFLEFWRQAAAHPDIWDVTVKPYRQFRGVFSRLIKDGIDEGSLRSVDPDAAALVLVSMGVGLVLQGALDPEEARPAGAGEQAVEMLLAGLVRKDPYGIE